MSQSTIPATPPTPMAHSHYVRLKAMLALALICVVGLAAATVILAVSNDATTSRGAALSTPSITGSDYRGDPYTTGGQAGSQSGRTGEGNARCLFHYHTC